MIQGYDQMRVGLEECPYSWPDRDIDALRYQISF